MGLGIDLTVAAASVYVSVIMASWRCDSHRCRRASGPANHLLRDPFNMVDSRNRRCPRKASKTGTPHPQLEPFVDRQAAVDRVLIESHVFRLRQDLRPVGCGSWITRRTRSHATWHEPAIPRPRDFAMPGSGNGQHFFGMIRHQFLSSPRRSPRNVRVGNRVPWLTHAKTVKRFILQLANHLRRREDAKLCIPIRIQTGFGEVFAQQIVMG